DVGIAIPARVFVEKAERVAEFVRGHPLRLTPPKSCDVDVRAHPFVKAHTARVVARVRFAGEMDILNLVRARDEGEVRAGVHPALHRALGEHLLRFAEFGNVIRNDAARPG
ncbi:MAG: hypothetical protein JWR69_1830, partial [Pedosphaera sp.]|nr:hypothetical protein [Pedosphaera sp.]